MTRQAVSWTQRSLLEEGKHVETSLAPNEVFEKALLALGDEGSFALESFDLAAHPGLDSIPASRAQTSATCAVLEASTLPTVLFLVIMRIAIFLLFSARISGSCRPDCTLSHHQLPCRWQKLPRSSKYDNTTISEDSWIRWLVFFFVLGLVGCSSSWAAFEPAT